MIERYSRQEMAELWSEASKYKFWGMVERACLETLAEEGKAPRAVLEAFDAAVSQKTAANFLAREQETAHDVIAYVAEIGEAMGGELGRFLHLGLTSSDIVDTANALRITQALQALYKELRSVRTALAERAMEHAFTPCMGRTHGIHAEPTSFGLALTSHFAEFQRCNKELLETLEEMRYGKLSGAVGNYSQNSPQFEEKTLARLGLKPEPVATQVIPRDRYTRVLQCLANIGRAVERLCLNIRHLARTEVGEVQEPFGSKQKGSSAMPHKKNPILAENLTGLARMLAGYAHMQENSQPLWHERDISHSSVERVALADAFILADFMLHRVANLVRNLVVRPEVMKANIARTGGLWASQNVLTLLIEELKMPRTQAYELVQRLALPIAERVNLEHLDNAFYNACKNAPEFKDILPEKLQAAFNVEKYLEKVPYIYNRVYGIDPQSYSYQRAEKNLSSEAAIPALHTVAKVTVELLPDVLDTETKAIAQHMAHCNIATLDMRQQKAFFIRIAESTPQALHDIEAYARETLHNPVMERVHVEVVQ